MPRNGSGTYTRPQADYVPGTTILATSVNSDLNDMAQALTASIARDGQTTPTANIPLGGFRITGLGNATSATDAVTLGQVDAVEAAVRAEIDAVEAIALAQNRNLIINGNPVINQRVYVSGTATAGANQYTLDRWRVVVSGQSLSWTDSAGIRTVTFPAGGGEQVIEALNNLGGVHTLSWIGTATATVNGASVANGGQITLTGNTDVTIRMSGGTASRIQLELGSVATSFERRPYGQELALCQRYFARCGSITIINPTGAAVNIAGQGSFPVTMRANPTLTATISAAGISVLENRDLRLIISVSAFSSYSTGTISGNAEL
jgi:hypothetical protein